jgi:hypothetical protein
MASPLTIYSSVSDGDIYKEHATYNTAWVATSGAIDRAGLSNSIGQIYYTGDKYYTLLRGFFFFDTSSIPVDATITLAILSLYGNSDGSGTDFLLTIQNGQPTYPHDPMVNGDYAKANYGGDGGSFNTTGWSAVGYNAITLNADGRSWIQKGVGALTKLCIRSSLEIAGTAPIGDEYISYWAAEKGAGYQPKLYVEYPGAGWANIKNIRMGTGTILATDIANIRMGTGSIAVADISDFGGVAV